jgi:hypothetical protein
LINLFIFPPHFIQICHWLVNLVYFFKEPHFWFLDSSFSFFLILALIFIFSPFLLVLCLTCSCFSRNLRYSIRLIICDLSMFLIYALVSTNFPFRVIFAVSHRFW